MELKQSLQPGMLHSMDAVRPFQYPLVQKGGEEAPDFAVWLINAAKSSSLAAGHYTAHFSSFTSPCTMNPKPYS